MKLYEIDEKIEHVLLTGIDRETGEVPDAVMEALDELEVEKSAKCLAVAAYIKGTACEADAVRGERDKLTKRANILESQASRLREYLADHFDGEKISNANTVIAWHKNPARVEITDESLLPIICTRLIPSRQEPDKNYIKSEFKARGKVPGAKLVESRRLVIT